MRIVLDTNVVVSAFLSPSGAPAHLFQRYQQDRFDILVSEPILGEYQEALNYSKVQAYHHMNEAEVAAVCQRQLKVPIVLPHSRILPAVERCLRKDLTRCLFALSDLYYRSRTRTELKSIGCSEFGDCRYNDVCRYRG